MSNGRWPLPLRRDVGVFSDLTLYVDTMRLAREHGGITAAKLREEFGPRMRAMMLVRDQSPSVARNLIDELKLFGWLEIPRIPTRRAADSPARLTPLGHAALDVARSDQRAFLRSLAERMQQVYVIPGWFTHRLWTINAGTGEVILPSPRVSWSPSAPTREARAWTAELDEQTRQSAAHARTANPQAFPIVDEEWQRAVRVAWERLRDRKVRHVLTGRDPISSTRSGLTLAMRAASLSLLFGCTPYGHSQPDFPAERPLTPKTFKPWCSRLQALELISYTDWHPHVTGRLLFPTALFRTQAPASQFEELRGIRHPDGRALFLHQPGWEQWCERFWQTLVAVYEAVFRKVQSRYVSLPDVRDEVCRRLRLSPARFELFLEQAIAEGPQEGGWHLSTETDMREDLRTGRGLARRPVYIHTVPHTLIAVAHLPRVPGSAS